MGDNRFKKMVIGEKLPDKDDPKYQKKYEEDVEAGRWFARDNQAFVQQISGFTDELKQMASKLDLAGDTLKQQVDNYKARQESPAAVSTQEEILRERLLDKSHTMIPIPQEDGTDKEN